MNFKKCIVRGYYEEDGNHVIEISTYKLVQLFRHKDMPDMEDVILEVAKELELEKPYSIKFI